MNKFIEFMTSVSSFNRVESYLRLIQSFKKLDINPEEFKDELLEIFSNNDTVPLIFRLYFLLKGDYYLLKECLEELFSEICEVEIEENEKLLEETYKALVKSSSGIRKEMLRIFSSLEKPIRKKLQFLLSQKEALVVLVAGESTIYLQARARCGDKLKVITAENKKIIKCLCKKKTECPFWGIVIN